MTELLPCFLLTPVGWGRMFESGDLDPDSILLFVGFVLDRPDSAQTARGQTLPSTARLHRNFQLLWPNGTTRCSEAAKCGMIGVFECIANHNQVSGTPSMTAKRCSIALASIAGQKGPLSVCQFRFVRGVRVESLARSQPFDEQRALDPNQRLRMGKTFPP